MADNTKIKSSGDSVSAGDSTDAKVSDNSTVTTTGGALSGGLSSATTEDVGTVQQGVDISLLPRPHGTLSVLETEDAIAKPKESVEAVLREHERKLKNNDSGLTLSSEMEVARRERQAAIARDMKDMLQAQRQLLRYKTYIPEGSVEVELSQDIVNGGRLCKKGETIKVDEPTAKFLEDAKAGKIKGGKE